MLYIIIILMFYMQLCTYNYMHTIYYGFSTYKDTTVGYELGIHSIVIVEV